MNSGDVRSHLQSARMRVRTRAAFVEVVAGLLPLAPLLLLLLLTPTEVAASCVYMTSCQVYEVASVVVQGTVTEMTDVELGTETIGDRTYARQKTLVTIDVEKAWKGATPETTVSVYTDGRRSSAGFEFVRGQRYVVFAHEYGGFLQTSICSHTNPIEKAGEDMTRAANDRVPYRFTAYPGTTQTEPVTPIALDTAQQLDLGVLTVALVQAKRVVQGRVSWADGRPISSPRIIVTEIRPDWTGPEVRSGGPVRVDHEGRFVVELHEGVSYRFVAEAPGELPIVTLLFDTK